MAGVLQGQAERREEMTIGNARDADDGRPIPVESKLADADHHEAEATLAALHRIKDKLTGADAAPANSGEAGELKPWTCPRCHFICLNVGEIIAHTTGHLT